MKAEIVEVDVSGEKLKGLKVKYLDNEVIFLNLTTHDIHVMTVFGGGVIEIPVSGKVARVDFSIKDSYILGGVMVTELEPVRILNLPKKEDVPENVVAIVSNVVKETVKNKGVADYYVKVVTPNTRQAMRDENGGIVAVKGFIY